MNRIRINTRYSLWHFYDSCTMIICALLFFASICACAFSRVKKQTDSIDIKNRMIIRDYIEKAISAHYKRDKKCLAEFWSVAIPDTSLYSRGKWLCGFHKPPIRTYWDSTLRNAFKKDKYIKVTPIETSIVLHPLIKWIYGVTLHLIIKGKKYSDEGYMFMVWDFRNPDAPQIHVRTWQPEFVDKTKGQRLNPNDVFTLGDFDL